MEPTATKYRPRVSRETRLLLTAGALAIVTLWLLARVRFRDLPATSSPIPAVLSQLTAGPRYDDLAAEIADLHPRVSASLVMLDERDAAPTSPRLPGIVALRYREDLAVTVQSAGRRMSDETVIASDPASHLTVVRVAGRAAVPLAPAWTSRRPERPRYLVATEPARSGVSLRPAFVGSLAPVTTALWPEPLWTMPPSSDLSPGSFLFTSSGELVGLVVAYGAERAVVPGATLFAEADRLLSRPKVAAGTIGVQVQALTPSIVTATGTVGGVVATWVNQDGPASGLRVGDVIEAVDAQPLGRDEWDVRMARLAAGQTVTLQVRSQGQVREVQVVAAALVFEPAAPRPFGLALRQRRGRGAEVVRVEPASAAASAGLEAGDLITLIGGIHAPTPAQVARSLASMPDGRPILVGVTRGDDHFVTTVER